MSLFRQQSGRRRIAAFVGPEYPVAAHAGVYEQLDAFAAALDAELRVVHEVVADPNEQPLSLRPRFGSGLFVPLDRRMHRNDVEHLRHTLAERFDGMVDALRDIGQCSAAAVIVRPEIQTACSMARWVRGWAPDLVVSFGLGEASMQAMIAAHLLDLPRLLVLDTAQGDTTFALLLTLHVQQATWVVTTNDVVYADLCDRFGDGIRARLLRSPSALASTPELLHCIVQRLAIARASSQPALGAKAAFRTRVPTGGAASRSAPQAFLVLGAARSGTNLLVGMLSAAHAQVTCVGELFNPRNIDEGRLPWLPASPVHEELLRLRHSNPGALHARLLREASALGATRVGFKLLYYHGLIDDRVVDHAASLEHMPIVHLTRRDRLARWLSMARAAAADLWQVAKGNEKPMFAPERLDARATVTDFALIELFEGRYRAVFDNHRVCEIDYTDLTDNRVVAAQQLGDLLGLELGPMTPQSLKTGPADPTQGIANLGEIRAAVAGTRWAALVPSETAGE